MGFGDVISIIKNLYKALKQAEEILAHLKDQESRGVELSPRLRNAMAMFELAKTGDTPDPDPKDICSFSDTSWYYLDLRDEIEAHPELLPANLTETFSAYKNYLAAAQAAGERNFDKERAKWEKKNKRAYRPKPRPNLIGEPLE